MVKFGFTTFDVTFRSRCRFLSYSSQVGVHNISYFSEMDTVKALAEVEVDIAELRSIGVSHRSDAQNNLLAVLIAERARLSGKC